MVIWPWVAAFLIIGYLTMGRSFAYLGVPPIFIGEIALAAFLALKPRVALGTWAASLVRSSPLSAFGLALLIFMAYGTWQVARGIHAVLVEDDWPVEGRDVECAQRAANLHRLE